jgi:hypothetical protein
MTNREIALEYLRCFCTGDIEGLEPLLAPDLIFNGTFHSFNSSEEYLASLRSVPPEKCQHNILSITENTDSVALFYEYQKPSGEMQMAQLFKISGQQINEILLVFDGRKIA